MLKQMMGRRKMRGRRMYIAIMAHCGAKLLLQCRGACGCGGRARSETHFNQNLAIDHDVWVCLSFLTVHSYARVT